MNSKRMISHNLSLIHYDIISTTKRLIFDIRYQHPKTINVDVDGRYVFMAMNGYSIISCKRMDIQTERLWLRGCKEVDNVSRSGSMVFSSNEDRNIACEGFNQALQEWNTYWMTVHD